MTDIPDDLSAVGTHHGNPSPSETGQTVRSPEGPDPGSFDAEPSPALFQVVRLSNDRRGQLTVQAHSPRAQVSSPEDGEEIGQYRTLEALRKALSEVDADGWTGVFEDLEADRLLVESDVTPDHAWIGQLRYPTITLFEDPDEATAFAEAQERAD